MKKILFLTGIIMTSQANRQWQPLSQPKQQVAIFDEIALMYPDKLAPLYNNLSAQERVFLYYMFRASLPGNRICADQTHRNSIKLIDLFESIVFNKSQIQKKALSRKAGKLKKINIDTFLNEATTYLIYLWTNHGQYFAREHVDQKRTPARLGLLLLTQENIETVLETLGLSDQILTLHEMGATIFDHTIEPTIVVPGSIEKSAVNFYAADFTQKDFEQLSASDQTHLNAFYYIDMQKNKRVPECMRYKIGGKYDEELRISLYWLRKAKEHAIKYPSQFDEYVIKSLDYLERYIQTGDEETFKKHCIEWIKSNSKLDYCWGFIENYDDPKSYRGMFQAEVTIKSFDIETLNIMLPQLEATLPFPDEFKRDGLLDGTATVPNASINIKAFTSGHLGPLNITAAYCLPNYQEIRSHHGSKQIIYEQGKRVGELINKDLATKLSHLTVDLAWHKKYDPAFQLDKDINMLQTILHETMGHASGTLTTHVFKEGDRLSIGGKTYKVGDEIPVTSENIQQFLQGYDQTLEELRAEIIAVLSTIVHFDGLAKSGLMGDWPQKIDKDTLIDKCILVMASTGLHRLKLQKVDATEIAGDHARANTTIMNYLIDHGGIELVEEQMDVKGKTHTVVGLHMKDRERAIELVKELALIVQKIKSTGDTQGVCNLIETYGRPVRHPEHIRYIKENLQAVVGDIKVTGTIYPHFEPLRNEKNEIVDIQATWPHDIVEQFARYQNVHLSID